jgi:hypothetical protein
MPVRAAWAASCLVVVLSVHPRTIAEPRLFEIHPKINEPSFVLRPQEIPKQYHPVDNNTISIRTETFNLGSIKSRRPIHKTLVVKVGTPAIYDYGVGVPFPSRVVGQIREIGGNIALDDDIINKSRGAAVIANNEPDLKFPQPLPAAANIPLRNNPLYPQMGNFDTYSGLRAQSRRFGGFLSSFNGPQQIRPLVLCDPNNISSYPPERSGKYSDHDTGQTSNGVSIIANRDTGAGNVQRNTQDDLIDESSIFFVKGLIGLVVLALMYAFLKGGRCIYERAQKNKDGCNRRHDRKPPGDENPTTKRHSDNE